MMRFKENKYNRVFVGLSNLIRYVCGGDRLKRITKIIDELLKQTYFKKNRKLKILDFGCGSMEISKKLKDKNYVGQIVGSDIFKHKYESNKMIYIDNDELYTNRKALFWIICGRHGVWNMFELLKRIRVIYFLKN